MLSIYISLTYTHTHAFDVYFAQCIHHIQLSFMQKYAEYNPHTKPEFSKANTFTHSLTLNTPHTLAHEHMWGHITTVYLRGTSLWFRSLISFHNDDLPGNQSTKLCCPFIGNSTCTSLHLWIGLGLVCLSISPFPLLQQTSLPFPCSHNIFLLLWHFQTASWKWNCYAFTAFCCSTGMEMTEKWNCTDE